MTKINQDCELTIREVGKLVVEISAIHNNQFKRRVYIGHTKETAIKKFKDELKKGE